MAEPPRELVSLLTATDDQGREAAWSAFVAEHSGLLLRTCRSLGGGYDACLDRYSYVLEHLSRDDFRRLRTFTADGRCKFTTWLVVVVSRLAHDHRRHRYGRASTSPEDGQSAQQRRSRRELADLVSTAVDPDELVDPAAADPDAELDAGVRRRALEGALGALEPGDRLLLRMRFDDALSAPEIARLMGFPTAFHVYRRLAHLFESLRRELRKSGFEHLVL